MRITLSYNFKLKTMKTILALSIQLLFISSLFSNVETVYNDDKVQISWNNPKHIEIDYFVLERSKNGVKFKEMKKIDTFNNNGSTIEYNEIDYSQFKTKAFYRIKQVDIKGHSYYSDIIVIEDNNIKPTFSLYSKANNDSGLKDYENEDVLVILLNNNKEKFVSKVSVVSEQNRLVTTHTSEFLPTGDYLVIGTSDDNIYGKKIYVNGSRISDAYTQNTK